jgi:hypothetical protein
MVLQYFNIHGQDIKSLRRMDGEIEIPVNGTLLKVPLNRYLFVRHQINGKQFAFMAKVCGIGQGKLSFDVLAAQSDHDRYKFNISVPFNEIVMCRLLKANDIPLAINWAWISPELRRKFFRVGR